MNLYLDTSSLFKLYVEEADSEAIRKISLAAETLSLSIIAYAEFRGSLARAHRSARLDAEAYELTLSLFEQDWSNYAVREVTDPLVQLAGDLAARHFLRGFDAVHLATAVTLQLELGEPVSFSSADGRLSEAAAAEGLTLP
jgi:predicted nucleic acid-binding protein